MHKSIQSIFNIILKSGPFFWDNPENVTSMKWGSTIRYIITHGASDDIRAQAEGKCANLNL